MCWPDHVPLSDVNPGGERQFPLCLGYIPLLSVQTSQNVHVARIQK